MIYDYIIVGMGPTGLVLGLNLLNTNKKVLFIERENEIGGCWKVNYDKDGYFTEHSPKVLSKTGTKEFNKLIKYLGISPNYTDIYKESTFNSLTRAIHKNFSLLDIIKFVIYIFTYILRINDKSISVKDWCNSNNISINTQNYINIVCIAISNTYDKLTMHSYIQFMFQRYQYLFNLQQLKQPNEWLSVCFDKLKSNQNFHFITNTTVKRFVIEQNQVKRLITEQDEELVANKYICCVPVRSLYYIMQNSFEANWFQSLNQLKYFVNKSSYTGIGFQLHYHVRSKLPKEWCWSCVGDWKIIVVDKTDLLDTISYDKDIKQVLSCVIVDLDSKSEYINRTVNECGTIEEIVDEGYRQVKKQGELLFNPKKITVSNNLYKSKEFGWESVNTSYSHSIGKLPMKGKLDNLFSIGPHNDNEVVVIDTAIKSAKTFVEKEMGMKPIF